MFAFIGYIYERQVYLLNSIEIPSNSCIHKGNGKRI